MITQQKMIKRKAGLIELAKHFASVSQACKVLGRLRDSFYRFRQRDETGGEQAGQVKAARLRSTPPAAPWGN